MDFNEFQDRKPDGGMELEPAMGKNPEDDFDFGDETASADTAGPDTGGEDEFGFGGDAEPEPERFSAQPIMPPPAGSTSFFGYFRKGFQMALLKGDAADEVASDPGSFVPALVIYLLPSFLVGGLLSLFMGVIMGSAMEQAGPAAGQVQALMPLIQKFSFSFVVLFPLMTLIGTLISVGILHLFAKILKGEGSFLDYYQTLGVGSLISWGGMIPYVGMLFSLWMLPVMVVITSRVHNLSTGRAVAVVLLPVVIAFVVVVALMGSIMMAFMGGMGEMQGM